MNVEHDALQNPLLARYKSIAASRADEYGIEIHRRGAAAGILVPALEPLHPSDLDRLSAWRNLHRGAFFSQLAVTAESTARWLSAIAANSDRVLFLIKVRGAVVGHIGLNGVDEKARIAETDAWLGVGDPTAPGIMLMGFATLLEWGFGALQLETISARVFSDNSPVLRAHDLLGYRVVRQMPYSRSSDDRAASWQPGFDGEIRMVTELVLLRSAFIPPFSVRNRQ